MASTSGMIRSYAAACSTSSSTSSNSTRPSSTRSSSTRSSSTRPSPTQHRSESTQRRPMPRKSNYTSSQNDRFDSSWGPRRPQIDPAEQERIEQVKALRSKFLLLKKQGKQSLGQISHILTYVKPKVHKQEDDSYRARQRTNFGAKERCLREKITVFATKGLVHKENVSLPPQDKVKDLFKSLVAYMQLFGELQVIAKELSEEIKLQPLNPKELFGKHHKLLFDFWRKSHDQELVNLVERFETFCVEEPKVPIPQEVSPYELPIDSAEEAAALFDKWVNDFNPSIKLPTYIVMSSDMISLVLERHASASDWSDGFDKTLQKECQHPYTRGPLVRKWTMLQLIGPHDEKIEWREVVCNKKQKTFIVDSWEQTLDKDAWDTWEAAQEQLAAEQRAQHEAEQQRLAARQAEIDRIIAAQRATQQSQQSKQAKGKGKPKRKGSRR